MKSCQFGIWGLVFILGSFQVVKVHQKRQRFLQQNVRQKLTSVTSLHCFIRNCCLVRCWIYIFWYLNQSSFFFSGATISPNVRCFLPVRWMANCPDSWFFSGGILPFSGLIFVGFCFWVWQLGSFGKGKVVVIWMIWPWIKGLRAWIRSILAMRQADSCAWKMKIGVSVFVHIVKDAVCGWVWHIPKQRFY